MNLRAFLIPGLGLNPQVLKKIELNGFELHYMRWINPQKDESLNNYALRISQLYNIPQDEDILILGHSFGGLLAQHLGIMFPRARIVLISTVKNASELPWKIRFLRHGYAYHLMSKRMILSTLSLWSSYHGYDEPELKQALISEVQSLDNEYFIWAYQQLIYWRGTQFSNTFLHIHGDRDRTFPIDNIFRCKVIPNGDHLMVYKKANMINQLISTFLATWDPPAY